MDIMEEQFLAELNRRDELLRMVATVLLVVGPICLILYLIGMWQVFRKAQEPGWKVLVPFYGQYVSYDIARITGFFWVWLALSVVYLFFTFHSGTFFLLQGDDIMVLLRILEVPFLFLHVILTFNLAKAFRKSNWFTLGLILLSPIFVLILGFGKSEYHGA